MSQHRYTIEAPAELRDAGDVVFLRYPREVSALVLDLGQVRWVRPIAVVSMLALLRRAMADDGVATVEVVPPQDYVCRDYLSAIGFFREVGLDRALQPPAAEPTLAIHPALPVRFVRRESEMEEAANRLEELLRENGAPPEVSIGAYVVLTELTNNAWEHGSECYVVAQVHSGVTSGTPGVHLAVADFGPGFKSTLASFGCSTEAEAIELAFQSGVSGTGQPMRGIGLSEVGESIDSTPASELVIVSRDALVRRADNRIGTELIVDCGGVFVAAYFPFTPRRLRS